MQFGLFQRADYSYSEFSRDVKKADNRTFGGDICSQFVTENPRQFQLSFYPLYLVDDNVFEVMACHFAVSSVVNQMTKKMTTNLYQFQVRSIVIPDAIRSRYDTDDVRSKTISNLNDFLHSVSPFKSRITRRIRPNISNVPKLAEIIMKMVKSVKEECDGNLAVVFDRQHLKQDGSHAIWVFECSDFSDLDRVDKNHCLSFDFQVSGVKTNAFVRCWLTFGIGQRLRWYPEYAVWIIPFLFVRSTTMTTHKVVEGLYSEEYKHGWRVGLDDKVFNKYYHIITGYEHVSNNYNRNEVKQTIFVQKSLRDQLEIELKYDVALPLKRYIDEHAYDSEAILQDVQSANARQLDGDNSNIAPFISVKSPNWRIFKFSIYRFTNNRCVIGAIHENDDCQHLESIIQNLLKFQKCQLEVNAVSVIDFDLGPIINAFDHIVRVHHFFSDPGKKSEIQSYMAQYIQCHHGATCPLLSKHSKRSRERATLEEKTEDPLKEVDALCDAVNDTLQSIHCYTLHSKDDSNSISTNRNAKLQYQVPQSPEIINAEESEEVKEATNVTEDSSPIGINFGVSVLQWLPYGVDPHFGTLKDEILGNANSKIDVPAFIHFMMICIQKIRNTNYTVNEMMCLKLYSDTTDLQGLLRKAHWTATTMEVQQAYYHWAMGLYRAHLYHAAPIPTVEANKSKPCRLYHGLSQMFKMTHELPLYNGPFSTTMVKDVATEFCEEKGLIWNIQSTFANPLRFCIGIVMDWISTFKHEREVLLFNQFLPIQKTDTFDDDSGVLVDHLMYSLQSRATPITDKVAFFKQLGIRFSSDWIAKISNHKLLFEETECGRLNVIDRLKNELGILFFHIFDLLRHAAYDQDAKSVTLRDVDEVDHIDISDYVFAAGFADAISSNSLMEVLHFDDLTQFAIPCDCVLDDGTVCLDFNIFCKAADDSFDFAMVRSLILPEYQCVIGSKLVLEKSVAIPRRDSRHISAGSLKIRADSDFTIASTTNVTGSNSVVKFFSDGTFTNNGTISCNGIDEGRLGSIYIVAYLVVNNGKLQCGPDGDIYIICQKYTNLGVVDPVPMVLDLSDDVDIATADDYDVAKWIHRYKHELTVSGYLRGMDSELSLTISDCVSAIEAISDLSYFHYEDFRCQQSILKDETKAKRAMKWIRTTHDSAGDYLEFLKLAVSKEWAERVWAIVDSERKGVVHITELLDFFMFSVVSHQESMGRNLEISSKKEEIKADLEHLAIWIAVHYGYQQADHSFHLKMTKQIFSTKMTYFVQQYIDECNASDADLLTIPVGQVSASSIEGAVRKFIKDTEFRNLSRLSVTLVGDSPRAHDREFGFGRPVARSDARIFHRYDDSVDDEFKEDVQKMTIESSPSPRFNPTMADIQNIHGWLFGHGDVLKVCDYLSKLPCSLT